MAVFKCKMCGGTLEVTEGSNIATCEFCDTKQTLPSVQDEALQNLFNRANVLRMKSEFDKASEVYDKILQKSPEEAEAYWGLILCKYGIEYVEDPNTYKRIPTCHRASYDAVTADDDYKNAIQYADMSQRIIYEEEAKTIDEVQKGIIALAQQANPYDVFICYKETDEDGKRTQDSVIANDIYYQLTQDGYKVFYAAITLEDKLGSEYEPYIFSALNTAKVLLAIGTRAEYFNAVWVKNEWSRFLKIMKKDRSKLLIPCYKGMDAYELPEEFAHLQAQDMSKIGFINDLVRGIKKVIVREDEASSKPSETTIVQNTYSSNVTALLERGNMALEDGEWSKADGFFEEVLNQDAKCVDAYLGKLMAELQIRKKEDLKNCAMPFDSSKNYQKTLRFANPELTKKLEDDNAYIRERNEKTRISGIYESATQIMNSAKDEDACKSAAKAFQSISGYKDSEELAQTCLEKAEECCKNAVYNSAMRCMSNAGDKITDYESAIRGFQAIPGWKDSDESALECQKRIDEIKEKREKRIKKIIAITAIILCICVVSGIVLVKVIIPNYKYNKAISLMNEGKIVEAYKSLIALDGYRDSDEKAREIFEQYMKEKEVGDTVYFGSYEQDNNTSNGTEDIEWIVLDKKKDRILVISKYALDCQKYNSTDADVTWETCSLRSWMNESFLDNAFSAEEQTRIAVSEVSADANPEYSTKPGNTTSDKIFLLSINEVNKYFGSDKERQCVPTSYAIDQGTYISTGYSKNGEKTCFWWLRSPGGSQDSAAYVIDGSVGYFGDGVVFGDIAVRPALWIDFESE